MEARLIRSGKEKELFDSIEANLDSYRSGDFSYIEHDPSSYITTAVQIDSEKLAEMSCSNDDHQEVENCIKIYGALENLNHYLARDSRLWVYLTHTALIDYSRNRWPIPDDSEKAIHHIKNHFFVVGARGFERDNAASRLWWMASLCDRVVGLTLEESLTVLLYQYDVRANIIERPTTALSVPVFAAILKKLHKSYQEDRALFERAKFRKFMRAINLRGGVSLISAMSENDVVHMLDDFVTELV